VPPPNEPRAEIIVRPGENTRSTLAHRARWKRRIQYGVILVALSISAWALLSMPKAGTRNRVGVASPAEDPVASVGFLSLGSRPSASVLIDGVDIGHTTPLLAWPLKSGSHRVRLMASGHSKDLSVDIRIGETHNEMVDLTPAAQKRAGR
jgi:hypothetical protein